LADDRSQTAAREERMEQWVREHGGQVYRTALYYMKDPAAAEDISQETFLLAFRHMDEFRGKGSPAGWLMRIAANQAKDALRSRWHRDVTKVDDWDGQLSLLTGTSSTEEDLANGAEMAEALGRLEDKLRRPLLLHYFYGFRDREIAVLLNLSPAAVRKRLERGRERLRGYLEGTGDLR
jgi:RNA polymerase sigma-70 factor (ECF subfamily)